MLSQLTNDLGQWHLVAYFLRKMIPVKIRYKTHDGELLAIVKAFKTCWHYLESCKYKVFVFTDHNNLCRFINTKSLSSRQVRWAQELIRYPFWIDYYQSKVNGAVDALSRFSQRENKEKANFQAENTWILHCLQSSLTNASIIGLYTMVSSLLPQHQVLICETYALS